MGIRLTGLSTPVIGAEWEYIDKKNTIKETTPSLRIKSNHKIKVFISSQHGDNGKYDCVRSQLKKTIEETGLADVYMFEQEAASTLTVRKHFSWGLEDSDLCIFLIDNADGVSSGVQKEIDIVKHYNKKALYYFCDETSQEKTAIEQSLVNSLYAKSKTVHRFEDLSQNGAQALIDDISYIYHHYCQGRLLPKEDEEENRTRDLNLNNISDQRIVTAPKSVVKNIDKCKDYIHNLVFGYSRGYILDENTEAKTSELDEWGNQFLEVLFGDKTIKSFNTGMFLEALTEEQDEDYHSLVCQRWNAIQAYYLGKVDDAIKLLERALTQAKDESKPDWVIQDILIDLRNLHWVSNTEHNCFVESEAQKELNEFEEELYYPSLDRIHNSLQGKYISGLYKKKIESPYSVTLGNDFNQYVELLASSFMVSIYNGSLTHILLFYDELRDFIFYLSSKYDDWNFRKDLLKYAVFKGSEKEIKGLQDAYPELLNMMTDKDAKEIIMFCANEPVRYKRFSSELLAMRAVGYYLNESDYSIYEKELLGKIQSWIENDSRTVINGQNIFLCLSGVGHRVAQDKLADICCSFMEHHFCHWYMDMFKFIAKTIDLNKLSNNLATRLIQDIISVMDNEQERQQVSYAPSFLLVFRKQNKDITEELDSKVAEVFPHYYNGDYLLGTQSEDEADYLAYISDYLEKIEENNLNQGKNGHYFGHGLREIATIRNILIGENIICPTEVMDKMISIVADTLLVSKEDIVTKLDAVSLLICVALKYKNDLERNISAFRNVVEKADEIEDIDMTFMLSNIDKLSLKIAVALLGTAIGMDCFPMILEGMAYLKDDIATTISVTRILIEYLENTDEVVFPKNIETVVLQNALQWLNYDHIDIRWNATKILLKLLRNPENQYLINQKVVELIDNDCVYIKNLILRRIYKVPGITKVTQHYILEKCKNDSCFVVRMVASEIEKEKM